MEYMKPMMEIVQIKMNMICTSQIEVGEDPYPKPGEDGEDW